MVAEPIVHEFEAGGRRFSRSDLSSKPVPCCLSPERHDQSSDIAAQAFSRGKPSPVSMSSLSQLASIRRQTPTARGIASESPHAFELRIHRSQLVRSGAHNIVPVNLKAQGAIQGFTRMS